MATLLSVQCSSCGVTVTRRRREGAALEQILCPTCCSFPDSDAAAYRDLANQALRAQLAMFDATGQYATASLPPISQTAWGKSIAEIIAAHRAALSISEPYRGGLMLFGPSGIGKTRAAIAVARAVGEYDPAGVLIRTEQSLFDPALAPWELPASVATHTAGKTLIIIDDIGVCYRRPEQIQSAWKGLCDTIAANANPVIVIGTTNRPGWEGEAGLTQWVGAQVTSRLRQYMTAATTGWTDHRTGEDHAHWRRHLSPEKR